MMDIINEFENRFGSKQMIEFSKHLYRAYDISNNDHQLWHIITTVFQDHVNSSIFQKLQKNNLANDFISSIVMRYFPGENVVKYHLIKKMVYKKGDILIFEMNAQASRADLCRINGNSFAYEIKTEIDSLERLSKQIESYSKLFEYVYVVAHASHEQAVAKLIPEHCGIVRYRLDQSNCVFSYRRKPKKSPNIDHLSQIDILSSADLKKILKWVNQDIPPSKKERIALIAEIVPAYKINQLFKQVLREKYASKWEFLQTHFDDIYPIDIQSFFRQTTAPEIVYYKPDGRFSSIANT